MKRNKLLTITKYDYEMTLLCVEVIETSSAGQFNHGPRIFLVLKSKIITYEFYDHPTTGKAFDCMTLVTGEKLTLSDSCSKLTRKIFRETSFDLTQ